MSAAKFASPLASHRSLLSLSLPLSLVQAVARLVLRIWVRPTCAWLHCSYAPKTKASSSRVWFIWRFISLLLAENRLAAKKRFFSMFVVSRLIGVCFCFVFGSRSGIETKKKFKKSEKQNSKTTKHRARERATVWCLQPPVGFCVQTWLINPMRFFHCSTRAVSRSLCTDAFKVNRSTFVTHKRTKQAIPMRAPYFNSQSIGFFFFVSVYKSPQ